MRKEYRRQKAKENFIKYLNKTWKNKLAAIAMIMIGVFSAVVLKEGAALVLFLLIGVPLFITKRNYYY